jgi:hypothetical protein
MGIQDKGLSAHVFFFLRDEIRAPALKRWLIHQNLTNPMLLAYVGISRSGVALKYPLDVTTCQNDKLIYVAPPGLGPGVIDQFEGERVQAIKKRYAQLEYDFDVDADIELMQKQELNRVRANALLPSLELRTRKLGKVEVLNEEVGDIRVTAVKEERGFVYLNLNGGDSWGYYHPSDNAKVLYNFKGEPNLSIEHALPSYYGKRQTDRSSPWRTTDTRLPDEEAGVVPETHDGSPEGQSEDPTGGWITQVGIDGRSGSYFGVRYHPETDAFEFTPIHQRVQVKDYCFQHGVACPDRLQRWEIGYDFEDFTYKIDANHNYINLFHPPDSLRTAYGADAGGVPDTIGKVLLHVVGDDEQAYELLLNWLACVVQYRRAIGTAWLLSGTQGTGKGLFFMNIMMPILGRDYVARALLSSFEEKFNAFMERSLVVFVDEIRLKDLKNASQALSNIKQLITDHEISIRKMRTDPYMVINRANFIFASNHYDSMEVDSTDRRFLIAPRQEKPLTSAVSLEGIEDRVRGEIPGFARYLANRPADLSLARRMYHSKERERLKHLTRNASDEVADAIRSGSAEFFVFEAPEKDSAGEVAVQAKLPMPLSYKAFLELIFESEGRPINIPRDLLRMAWYHLTGAWFQTPAKFSKFVGRLGLEITRIRIGDKTFAGLSGIQFELTDEAKQEYARWLVKQRSHIKPVTSSTSTSSGTGESSS